MRVQKDYIHSLTASNVVKEIVNAHSTYTKTLIARPLAVTHIEVDSFNIINEHQLDCIDSGVLRSIITNFWTSKYGGLVPTPTTVNAYITAFKEYIETATRMVGRFLCLKRCQDQWNLDNDDIGQLGSAFCNVFDVNIASLDSIITNTNRASVDEETVTNGRLTHTYTVFGDLALAANSISSAAWTRYYTTPLKNVYLPIEVTSLLNLLFAGTIELSSDDDETVRYVQFWQVGGSGFNFPSPSQSEGSIANFLTYYNQDYGQLQTLMSSYPMLMDILTAMGYVSALDYVNTRRDLSGKTLHVIRDRNDQLEFAIKSVLLAQSDRVANTDIVNNSVIIDVKQPYLEEIVLTTPFTATVEKLYNFENFIRGKISISCVNILTMTKPGGGTNHTTELAYYCGDNVTIHSDARTNADWTRYIASSEDTVTETDALVSTILHAIDIDANNNISVFASYVEGSSKTYIVPEGIIGNLLYCVNSGMYIDMPRALAELAKVTLYETNMGATNYLTFGDTKGSSHKHPGSNKSKDKKDKKPKDPKKDSEGKPGEPDLPKDTEEKK